MAVEGITRIFETARPGEVGLASFISDVLAGSGGRAVAILPSKLALIGMGGPGIGLPRAGGKGAVEQVIEALTTGVGGQILGKIFGVAKVAAPAAIGAVAAGSAAAAILPRIFGGGGGPDVGTLNGFATIKGRSGKISKLITSSGKIINVTRRRRGISATELRGFRKVASLVRQFGGSRVARTPRRRR